MHQIELFAYGLNRPMLNESLFSGGGGGAIQIMEFLSNYFGVLYNLIKKFHVFCLFVCVFFAFFFAERARYANITGKIFLCNTSPMAVQTNNESAIFKLVNQ